MYALELEFPKNIFLMIGLHPCYVKENFEEELAHVERELSQHKFYAIGEIGIDLYWDKAHWNFKKRHFDIKFDWLKNTNYP